MTCISSQPAPIDDPTVLLPAIPGTIVINEVLSTPHRQWNCEESDSSANIWLELYNPGDQAFNLPTSLVVDTGPNTASFKLPFGTAIAPHGFITLFPFTKQQAYFSILRLRIGDTIIDAIDTIPPLAQDTSYARQTDGGSSWYLAMSPTIGASNSTPPVPATPTKTPNLTKTPKATKTPRPTGTPRAAKTATQHPSPTPQIDGTQPNWNTLVLPNAPSPTTIVVITSTAHHQLEPAAEEETFPWRNIGLTLLATVLVASLCWYGRRFVTS